ncbi:MAG: HAMP domain-containing histidine kinase [Magnetococcales bacterium]|nr:HAMP domain-containing histidine kinase [Magnetococcales bacterium]
MMEDQDNKSTILSYAIRDMIAKAVKSIRKKYQHKELVFSSEVADDVPEMVDGDSGYTRQLLTRILDNAFKFTKGISLNSAVAKPASGWPICRPTVAG